jgi:hypothetical protein
MLRRRWYVCLASVHYIVFCLCKEYPLLLPAPPNRASRSLRSNCPAWPSPRRSTHSIFPNDSVKCVTLITMRNSLRSVMVISLSRGPLDWSPIHRQAHTLIPQSRTYTCHTRCKSNPCFQIWERTNDVQERVPKVLANIV